MKDTLDRIPQTFTHCCPECQRPLSCDLEAGKSSCWCFSLPFLSGKSWVPEEGQRCLCRACLQKAVAAAAGHNLV